MKINLNIPDGVSGNWAVSNFTVTEAMAGLLKVTRQYEAGRDIPPGDYVRLLHRHSNGLTTCVMSNTPAEIRDHEEFIMHATGDILINGLGLGMCIQGILDLDRERPKELVRSITVIEREEDVIKLVAPSITDPRVEIVHMDAFEFEPKEIYDYVWHDIWPDIAYGNLPSMEVLYNKYENFSAWQGAWALDLCIKDFDDVAVAAYSEMVRIRKLFSKGIHGVFDRLRISKKDLNKTRENTAA